MKDTRPVNLDIGTIQLPFPAYVSLLHRVSGVFLFAATAVLLWLLGDSLASPDGFAAVQQLLDTFIVRLVIWAILAGLIYHSCAGIRHLLMDGGVGESLEGGELGAKLVVICFVVLTAAVGVWIW